MTKKLIDVDALIARARAYDVYVPCDLSAPAIATLADRVDEAARVGRALVIARLRGVPWKILMRNHKSSRTRLWHKWHAAKAELADQLEEMEKMFREHQDTGTTGQRLMQ